MLLGSMDYDEPGEKRSGVDRKTSLNLTRLGEGTPHARLWKYTGISQDTIPKSPPFVIERTNHPAASYLKLGKGSIAVL